MKKQILNRVSFFVVILLLFSCRKDLETPTQVSTPRSEKPTGQFYNQASTIDVTILLSLEQDTLFNEYVYFLDYTYLLHLADSLRKTTNNEKEFNAKYLAIMEKRSGTLKERFVKTKEHYPKDFFKYVTYESKLKRDNRKTKNVDIDDVIVDGSEEVYSKMANCYNSIYGAFLSLANRSYVLYSSKINKCHYKWCLSHERLVKSTMEGLALGINSLSNTQGLSYNFTRRITSADVRMAIENGYIDRMTVNELREESEFCIRLIDSVLAWNSNFELTFVISMSCYESHDSGGTPSGGGSGGTTPPTDPNISHPNYIIGKAATEKILTDLENRNVKIKQLNVNPSTGEALLYAAGVGVNVNSIAPSVISMIKGLNSTAIKNYGTGLGAAGVLIGGTQTIIALIDEDGAKMSTGEILNAISTGLSAVGLLTPYFAGVPVVAVITGVAGVAGAIVGIIASTYTSEAFIIKISLKNGGNIVLHIPASAPSPLIC